MALPTKEELRLRTPKALRHLPRSAFTARRPATREEASASHAHVAFGVRSVGELLDEAGRRIGAKATGR